MVLLILGFLINYKSTNSFEFDGYRDNDYGGYLDNPKNTSRLFFPMGSGVIYWSSNKQITASLSTTWLQYLLHVMQFGLKES